MTATGPVSFAHLLPPLLAVATRHQTHRSPECFSKAGLGLFCEKLGLLVSQIFRLGSWEVSSCAKCYIWMECNPILACFCLAMGPPVSGRQAQMESRR